MVMTISPVELDLKNIIHLNDRSRREVDQENTFISRVVNSAPYLRNNRVVGHAQHQSQV